MVRWLLSFLATGVAMAAVAAGDASAGERLAGPVAAETVKVIDGDSIEVRARLWLGLDLTVQVRIRGIDAPEMRGQCSREKALAEKAKKRLADLAAGQLKLANITPDKFGRRVDADVSNGNGTDLKSAMLAAGLARAYDGGERGDWCELARLGG